MLAQAPMWGPWAPPLACPALVPTTDTSPVLSPHAVAGSRAACRPPCGAPALICPAPANIPTAHLNSHPLCRHPMLWQAPVRPAGPPGAAPQPRPAGPVPGAYAPPTGVARPPGAAGPAPAGVRPPGAPGPGPQPGVVYRTVPQVRQTGSVGEKSVGGSLGVRLGGRALFCTLATCAVQDCASGQTIWECGLRRCGEKVSE